MGKNENGSERIKESKRWKPYFYEFQKKRVI